MSQECLRAVRKGNLRLFLEAKCCQDFQPAPCVDMAEKLEGISFFLLQFQRKCAVLDHGMVLGEKGP